MTDLIIAVANDPLLMDAASEQSGFACRQLIHPKRAVLSSRDGNFLQTPLKDFTLLVSFAVSLQCMVLSCVLRYSKKKNNSCILIRYIIQILSRVYCN